MSKNRKNDARHFTEIEGVFMAAPSGFGFVERPGRETVFIPADKVRNAVRGDRVAAVITDPEGRRNLGPVGEIRAVISRSKRFIVGELLPGRLLNPLDEHFNGKVKITGSVRGVKVGDWIKVRLLDAGGKFTEALKGEIVEKYGAAGSIAADLQAVIAEFERKYISKCSSHRLQRLQYHICRKHQQATKRLRRL